MTDYNRFSCNLCGFPKFIPESPNSKIGENMFYRGCSLDALKSHFLKHHPYQYKDLLKEIGGLRL